MSQKMETENLKESTLTRHAVAGSVGARELESDGTDSMEESGGRWILKIRRWMIGMKGSCLIGSSAVLEYGIGD